MDKNLNKQFTKDIQMANKHKKTSSSHLSLRKCKLNNTDITPPPTGVAQIQHVTVSITDEYVEH